MLLNLGVVRDCSVLCPSGGSYCPGCVLLRRCISNGFLHFLQNVVRDACFLVFRACLKDRYTWELLPLCRRRGGSTLGRQDMPIAEYTVLICTSLVAV